MIMEKAKIEKAEKKVIIVKKDDDRRQGCRAYAQH